MALLCELMLRGPQTPGELRSRSERLYPFGNLEEVDSALGALAEHDPPLVVRLPREAGRKEQRYMHLLSGVDAAEEAAQGRSLDQPSSIEHLQEEIDRLRSDLEELRREFAEFRSQF
jgi:uncharacterized protein YceH (UPF0502 family)